MPIHEAPCVELGNAPEAQSVGPSPSPSELSSASSPEPQNIRATPLFRALAMRPPEPQQPPGQDELERRLPGYRRIVIPRELTLIELLKEYSGVTTDEEVLRIREAKLRVVAERVGLRRLHVLAPRLRALTLDGSALSSLRDLGIGLVHLKILSVNRCGLTCLDGVWGLGALRELYAAGNRLRDLQPMGALQKLQTLDLSDNPIIETNRIWTLGVCGSLRRLTLRGTSVADDPNYRTCVASVLPMLVYLDDRPLHSDIQYDSAEQLFDEADSSSDSEDVEPYKDVSITNANQLSAEPEPGPSTLNLEPEVYLNKEDSKGYSMTRFYRRRPATTECAGIRPSRPNIPSRPRTAQAISTVDPPSRFQILNTLMDEEWRCSGSRLTSQGAVCGNLARALRRPSAVNRRNLVDYEADLVKQTMEEASRALAEEIPRAPLLEEWARFKEETGIDIDIDFNQRPKGADGSTAIDRLEQIERETSERLKQETPLYRGTNEQNTSLVPNTAGSRFGNHYDFWREVRDLSPSFDSNIDLLFANVGPRVRRPNENMTSSSVFFSND